MESAIIVSSVCLCGSGDKDCIAPHIGPRKDKVHTLKGAQDWCEWICDVILKAKKEIEKVTWSPIDIRQTRDLKL